MYEDWKNFERLILEVKIIKIKMCILANID